MQKRPQPATRQLLQVWKHGLSRIRALNDSAAREQEWNFGACSPPSYLAFGRMRALLASLHTAALPGQRVLEVAAGDGALAAGLAAAGRQVTANDLRTEHLQASLQHFAAGARVRTLGGNVFELDAATVGTFDLIIACEVIEHVAHPDHFLAKLHSLLALDGALYLTTPNGRYFRNKLPSFSQVSDPAELEQRQFKPDADGHLFLLTPAELRALGHAAGFAEIAISFAGSPFITGHSGFRTLRALKQRRAMWWAERGVLAMPAAVRERACFLLIAVLEKR